MLADFGYKVRSTDTSAMPAYTRRLNFDLQSQEGIAKFRKFVEQAADLVVSYGGSLSGEHGDGQSRAELLPKMFGPELMEAFRKFKTAWDPDWKMNPGKLIEPYKLDENLRLGPTTPLGSRNALPVSSDHGSLRTRRCAASESESAAAKKAA